MQLAVAERVSHLDVAAWASLTAGEGIFLDPRYLTALEVAGPANVKPRYALMYKNDEPIAALSMQLVELEGGSALNPSHDGLRGVTKLVRERALLLGSLTAWGSTGISIKPGVDPRLVWAETLRMLDDLRRFERVSGHVNIAALKDLGVHGHDQESTFRQRGYLPVDGGPDMLLTVDPAWRSFDGYLASLNAKRRRAVKKTCLDVDAARFRLRPLSLEDVAANSSQLEALYGQVWSSAEVRPCRLPGAFFVELKRRLGDDFEISALERDGVMLGFASCLRSGSTCVAYYLGYDKGIEAPLYLRLLIATLEQAFAWGSALVSLGRTAEEPKARLGARANSSTFWVKHRVPPLNWAIGAVLGSLPPAHRPSSRAFRSERSVPPVAGGIEFHHRAG